MSCDVFCHVLRVQEKSFSTSKRAYSGSRRCWIQAICFALIAAGGLNLTSATGQIIFQENFEADLDGWSIATSTLPTGFQEVNTFSATRPTTGGNGGGYAQGTEHPGVSYWKAPPGFLGAYGHAYGGILSFDLIQSVNSNLNPINGRPDVVLIHETNEPPLVYVTPYPPEKTPYWSRYHVLLAEGSWRVGTTDGPLATAAQIHEILGYLNGLYIRAEFSTVTDTHGIDNITMRGPDPYVPASYFDNDAEDWWVVNDAKLAARQSSGGNPGGFFQATDISDGRYWYFLAPAKFLGDRGFVYGGSLEFDLRVSSTQNGTPRHLCALRGANLLLHYNGLQTPEPNTWTHFSIPMYPTFDWYVVSSGDRPTPEQFSAALSSLTQLEIRGEWTTAVDTDGIDNVIMNCTPVILSGPSNAVACGLSEASTQVSLNWPVAYSYRWQIEEPGSPGNWVTLSNEPVSLSCGGSFYANPFDGPNTFIGANPCPGIMEYHIRTIVLGDCTNTVSNSATLTIAPKGDMNCDGAVNGLDVSAFSLAEMDPDLYAASLPGCDIHHGDMNCDGAVTYGDIEKFVTCVMLGACP